MGNRAIEKDRPDKKLETGDDPKWPHPFDRWLRRELQGLYGAAPGDPLPDVIADLAAKLEERLTTQEDRAEGDDDGAGSRDAERQR